MSLWPSTELRSPPYETTFKFTRSRFLYWIGTKFHKLINISPLNMTCFLHHYHQGMNYSLRYERCSRKKHPAAKFRANVSPSFCVIQLTIQRRWKHNLHVCHWMSRGSWTVKRTGGWSPPSGWRVMYGPSDIVKVQIRSFLYNRLSVYSTCFCEALSWWYCNVVKIWFDSWALLGRRLLGSRRRPLLFRLWMFWEEVETSHRLLLFFVFRCSASNSAIVAKRLLEIHPFCN